MYIYIFLFVPVLYLFYPSIEKQIHDDYKIKLGIEEVEYDNDPMKLLSQQFLNYTSLFSCIIVFFYLIYLMKKYHRLEYETKINQMTLFFTNFVALIICLFISTSITDTRLVGTPTICFFRKPELVAPGIIDFWLYLIGWFPIWISFTLLYLKSD